MGIGYVASQDETSSSELDFSQSDVLSSEPGLEGRAERQRGSLTATSIRLEEDVSWAVEQWAEGGWRREGSLSKDPPPPPPPPPPPSFTSTITTNGGREAGV
ncbi:hypothetical protein EYF80_052107 [Liparis tanakae]|uniref:Uncharacterized protein n=1 Tax=Liparis tanakae TaxID=230148 RepID=A0A4Z2F985_9TELE|nr:hypothetical protein EYF80_052107 [Liparis tanakae]